jgi:hypothetical protein
MTYIDVPLGTLTYPGIRPISKFKFQHFYRLSTFVQIITRTSIQSLEMLKLKL